MTKILSRIEMITNALFQDFGLCTLLAPVLGNQSRLACTRKSSLSLSIPKEHCGSLNLSLRQPIIFQLLVGQVHCEDPPSRRNQCNLANRGAKGAEQLLAEVRSSQHPLALCAISDSNTWEGGLHDGLGFEMCQTELEKRAKAAEKAESSGKISCCSSNDVGVNRFQSTYAEVLLKHLFWLLFFDYNTV